MKRLLSSALSLTAVFALVLCVAATPGFAGDEHKGAAPAADEPLACEGTEPINAVCPITNDKIVAGGVTDVYRARYIGFSSEKAKAEWASWDAKKKDAFLLKFVRPGPVNDTCPIGKEAIVLTVDTISYEGSTIGFCCPSCAAKFEAWDKAKKDAFVKPFLEAALVNKTCPMTNEAIDDTSPTVVFMAKKIAFCCKGCARKWDLMPNAEKAEKVKAISAAAAK